VLIEEQAARELERQRYRDLFDLVPVAALTTTTLGIVQQANRAAADLLGVHPGRMRGKPLPACIVEWPARIAFFTRLRWLRTEATGPLVFEERLRARGGREFPARLAASAIPGPAGQVAGLEWIIRELGEGDSPSSPPEDGVRRVPEPAPTGAPVGDAGAHQQRLAHADDAESRYRSLFDGAVDAVVLFGPDRRLAEANPAAHDLLGYARHDIDRPRLDDLIVGDAERLGAIMAGLRSDGVWRGEVDVRRKDGAIVPVDAAMTTVTVPAGVAFWAALRDITARRRRHDEVERARSDRVAMIGHELRAPLNGILLHAELLKLTGSYRETSVDAILASVQQEQRLVEDLVELARAETGRPSLRPSRVDLTELVRSCIAGYQPTVGRHVLRIDAPARMPAGHWDRARLEQVCHNLLANAVKYSPDGGEILVRVEDLGDRARLTVADQGVGIAADALPHVFDRFFRARTADAGPGGLGLGLHITKALVEAHGGTISAESEPGGGSVFHVTLPYEPPSATDDGAGADGPTLELLERRVLELIAQGLSNREIAEQLGVPVEAVRDALDAIFVKLGASSKLEALIFAIRHGLIRLPPP
jgi:PAS domain S-box-containing protein